MFLAPRVRQIHIKMILVISFLVHLGAGHFQERGACLRLATCIRDCGPPYYTIHMYPDVAQNLDVVTLSNPYSS